MAVAEALRDLITAKRILPPQLYYMAKDPYNERLLFEQDITFIPTPAGKLRRYFSIMNLIDAPKVVMGLFSGLMKVYNLYPDVVFSKGGYPALPALFGAKLLNIPVVIHESDSHPGRVTLWSAKFARKIAISYPQASKYFRKKDQAKIAYTGNPIRPEIANPLRNGAHEYLKLEEGTPTIFVIGGSQGAAAINDALLEALPDILNKYQVIHQTGKNNIEEVRATTGVMLKDHPYAHRYRPFDYLNALAMRMAAGVADIVVSRGGSGGIFEIASWGVPSIIIPLPKSISHDQTDNAFAYASTGAASVLEQENLHGHILAAEIDRIYGSSDIKETMRERARSFARPDSAKLIAAAILDIALQHER